MGKTTNLNWCKISAINSMGMIIFHIAILLKDSVDLDGKWKFGGDVPLPHPQIPGTIGFFYLLIYHQKSSECREIWANDPIIHL